jgi:hypothetical protein
MAAPGSTMSAWRAGSPLDHEVLEPLESGTRAESHRHSAGRARFLPVWGSRGPYRGPRSRTLRYQPQSQQIVLHRLARLGPDAGVLRAGRHFGSSRPMRCPYAALEAFLTEHQLCRPGPDDPDVSPMLVALWCSCGARLAVRLPGLHNAEGGIPMNWIVALFALLVLLPLSYTGSSKRRRGCRDQGMD